jgi:hypothetical protein
MSSRANAFERSYDFDCERHPMLVSGNLDDTALPELVRSQPLAGISPPCDDARAFVNYDFQPSRLVRSCTLPADVNADFIHCYRTGFGGQAVATSVLTITIPLTLWLLYQI